MSKNFFLIIILIIICQSAFSNQIHKNYVQVYGEGPIGQYLLGFEKETYTKEDAVNYARDEVMEFLSGMVYGYKFVYKVENKITGQEGFFDLIPLAVLKFDKKIIRLTQLEQSDFSIRIQAVYRMSVDQKTYMEAFKSSIADTSMGTAEDEMYKGWKTRLDVYKNALQNSVLNEARKKIKSRPLYIKGKLLLQESPKITIISGKWHVLVRVNVIIQDVSYRENY